MRTEDGEEIVEPGDYVLNDERTLRVYLTQGEDEQVQMWACTHCQEVDGVLNAILTCVIDGLMDISQDEIGKFRMKMTSAGNDHVRALIERLADGGETS